MEIPVLNNFKKLNTLGLSSNKIARIPDSFFENLTTLKSLDISVNHIRSLPPSISLLTSLTLLNVGCNSLYATPEELCGLTSLQKLHLQGNVTFQSHK